VFVYLSPLEMRGGLNLPGGAAFSKPPFWWAGLKKKALLLEKKGCFTQKWLSLPPRL